MEEAMAKAFDPTRVEPQWRRCWDELGVGTADPTSAKPAFTIALPPPNITGVLHMGHACGSSIQDVLSRYHRMLGDEVEWCPGTDHAAIATNAVVERLLVSEGTSREEVGREQFLARVDSWYQEYGGRILEQMKTLGFTCDWSRLRFTLDEDYVRAIRVVFKTLYDEGLIYRGPRIVNWCPYDQSAISDEEVEWVEHTDSLVQLRYAVEGGGEVVVATVRPETMLGDTAVAVAPGDTRYAHLVGKTAILPLVGRRIPIIADAEVKPEFGTGCLKVTPGHDPADYAIGERHGLPAITVIAPDGTMDVPELPQFHGLPADKARGVVTEALRKLGVVVNEEPYVHDVGHCDRCHHVLEPLISAQWWVKMASLAAPAIKVVEEEQVRFHPSRYRDIYLNWMHNIRDWCISRQIWLGHAIPVSTCANKHTFAWIDEPSVCPKCGDAQLVHDPDVLDTWFSSALWPFAIFGWPEDTVDLRRFYPTSTLVTDRGIIFLWVARMIMSGLKFAGNIPFSDVIITSTIQAADGSRMSKSKGNAIDPLQMVQRYGADAVRAWGAAVGTGGQDVRFDEEKIASYQRFANKIWNVTRFITQTLDGAASSGAENADLAPEDAWMLGRVCEAIDRCDAAISGYRFHDALDTLYQVFWHDFCDEYVEMAKKRLQQPESAQRQSAVSTLLDSLDVLLRLLHPFMPFITEACAQRLPAAAPSLQTRSWPQAHQGWRQAAAMRGNGVEQAIELMAKMRAARQDAGIPSGSKEKHAVRIRKPGPLQSEELARLLLARTPVAVPDAAPADVTSVILGAGDIEVEYYLGDSRAQERMRGQLQQLKSRIARLRTQLDNQQFVSRAPAEVVAAVREQLREAEQQAKSLQDSAEC